MRLYDGSEELVAGAVVKALRGGDDALACCRACTTARRGLSLVAGLVRRLGGGCRLLQGLYDGSEEAVVSLGESLAFTRGTVN
jgi:hypothetical protein